MRVVGFILDHLGKRKRAVALPHPWGPPWPASLESRLRPGRHHGARGEVSIWGPDKVLASHAVCSSTLSEV